MAQVMVDAGICGFTTQIRTTSADMQAVQISYESDCPHVNKAKSELVLVDAFQELFKKPHETHIYAVLSKHLPHVTCPLYSGFLKAIEVAARLALPKNATIDIER
jgi:hypothetical protein